MIIGINGYSNSGKDTVGIIIQYLKCTNKGNISIEDAITNYEDHQWWLEEKSEWEIKKFAAKLKDIASHLTGIDIEDFEDQEFKKTLLGSEWGMTVREFLQKLGTDALRTGLHDNVWVNALMADYVAIGDNLLEGEVRKVREEDLIYPNWIITDTRFPNEAQVIKDKGGIVIRINRPGIEPINNHPSEVGLDHWKFDYKIVNNSDLFELKENVKSILKHIKVL